MKTAQDRYDFSLKKWEKECGDQKFKAEKERLNQIYSELSTLDHKLAQEKRHLEHDIRNYQLRKWLEAHEVSDAGLPGIGTGLTATLGSFGFETAHDIGNLKVGMVPGFGQMRVSALLAWRKSIESSFVFKPASAIDPKDILTLKNKYDQSRTSLGYQLARGEIELKNIKNEILKKRATWQPQLEALALDVAQKQTNMQIFN